MIFVFKKMEWAFKTKSSLMDYALAYGWPLKKRANTQTNKKLTVSPINDITKTFSFFNKYLLQYNSTIDCSATRPCPLFLPTEFCQLVINTAREVSLRPLK